MKGARVWPLWLAAAVATASGCTTGEVAGGAAERNGREHGASIVASITSQTPSQTPAAVAGTGADTVAVTGPGADTAAVASPGADTAAVASPGAGTKIGIGGRAQPQRSAGVRLGACDDGPCTLAAWMKAYAAPAMISRDFDALATILARAETFAPPAPASYTNWASIAGDGAAAARAQDLEAVRAACRSCHAQYKVRYKQDLHGRVL